MLLVGLGIGYWLGKRAGGSVAAGEEEDDSRTRENLDKIVAMFGDKAELGNDDVRDALGVSDRTAVRYMDELERQGKVEQVGQTGRGVTYRLKS